jgi:hypothetical protein
MRGHALANDRPAEPLEGHEHRIEQVGRRRAGRQEDVGSIGAVDDRVDGLRHGVGGVGHVLGTSRTDPSPSTFERAFRVRRPRVMPPDHKEL